MKNKIKVKKVPHPVDSKEAASKHYVVIKFIDLSILRTAADSDLTYKKFVNIEFVRVN